MFLVKVKNLKAPVKGTIHSSVSLLGEKKCLPCCVHTQYLRTNCHSEGFRVICQCSAYKEVTFLISGLLSCVVISLEIYKLSAGLLSSVFENLGLVLR